jgi:ribosomal protein S20
MPIIKSAKKRVRTAEKAAVRNSKTKRSLKTALKSFHKALSTGSKDTAELHKKAQSALDKTAKKGLSHKNKVARQQKQLAARTKAAGVKPTKTVKAPAKKTTAPKKTVAAKSVAKKTAKPDAKSPAKKAVTKKPAVKKAPAKKPTAKKAK